MSYSKDLGSQMKDHSAFYQHYAPIIAILIPLAIIAATELFLRKMAELSQSW